MSVAVRPTRTSSFVRGLRRVPFMVGLSLGFLGLMVFVFLFADLIATHDVTAQDLTNRLKRPAILGGRRSSCWAPTNSAAISTAGSSTPFAPRCWSPSWVR